MEKVRRALYVAAAAAVLVAVACGVYVFGLSGTMGADSSGSAPSASSDAGSISGASDQTSSDTRQQASSASGSAHTHMWRTEEKTVDVPAVTHTETVARPGEDIVEYHTVCDDCGAYLDSDSALKAHYRNYPGHAEDGYTTGVPVVTGQKPGETETVTVVDEPAATKTVVVKTCAVCGAVEEKAG